MFNMKSAALIRATALSVALLAVPLAFAQVPIGQLGSDGITIKGRVAELFGDKFILEDDSGRILVEMRGGRTDVKAGDVVLATGLPQDRVLHARRVTRENGDVIFNEASASIAAAPVLNAPGSAPVSGLSLPEATDTFAAEPTSSGITQTLRSAGLTALSQPVRHKKHIEIPARTETGTEVIVSLDRAGRLWEVEDAAHDHHDVRATVTTSADAERALRHAGYTPRGAIERRKHHFEVMALNPRGELVEVHMNLAGHVYKQAWMR